MRRRKRRRRKQNTTSVFTFTSYMPKTRKAKKRAKKVQAQNVQTEKLNNENDGFESSNGSSPFENMTEQEVLRDMDIHYNWDSDTKRFNTMMDRKFIKSLNEYNKIMSIYQSDIYVKLKELGYSDSYQIRDLVQSFDSNISAKDLEYALLSLIDTLKLQQTYNTEQIREAMDLGFSFKDAVYLTESDRVDEIKADNALLEIRDRLNALLETREIRKELEIELRSERW